jgi:hypothetical protein
VNCTVIGLISQKDSSTFNFLLLLGGMSRDAPAWCRTRHQHDQATPSISHDGEAVIKLANLIYTAIACGRRASRLTIKTNCAGKEATKCLKRT